MDGSTPSSIGIVAAREVTNRVMQIIQDHGGQMVNHSTTPLWLVDFDVIELNYFSKFKKKKKKLIHFTF